MLKDRRLIWQHDGNGRTGRLLIPLMLAAEGFPPRYVSGPCSSGRVPRANATAFFVAREAIAVLDQAPERYRRPSLTL